MDKRFYKYFNISQVNARNINSVQCGYIDINNSYTFQIHLQYNLYTEQD